MTVAVYIPDYRERALAMILGQFDGSPVLQALVRIIADEIQELERVILDVWASRLIDLATGVQLDLIGKIVVLPREGLLDDDYRKLLLVKIQVNVSDGTPEEVIDVVRRVTGARVHYSRLEPIGFQVEMIVQSGGEPSDALVARLKKFLDLMRPAAVPIGLVSQTISPGYFGFAEDPNALGFDQGRFLTTVK